MIEVVEFKGEEKYIKDFLRLPLKLYSKENLMEDRNNTLKILKEEHVLSKYFKVYKFVAYKDEVISGRFILTIYPNDETCYIGFYECVDNDDVSKALFDKAYESCKKLGLKKLLGPVDCSFWIKYRLKINKFDERPYTGEPYNKDYYKKQFENNGFIQCEHYTSQVYKVLDGNFKDEKFEEHFKEFKDKGYKFVKPSKKDFPKIIVECYKLIMELYSDFPIFKYLSQEDFVSNFNGLSQIGNMELVRMAYYNEKPVGFYISIPNYNNLVCNVNLWKLLKILKIKKKPNDYVMLYMGVDKEHRGLGKALSKSIADELNELKKPSIGALARDGKINQNYAQELIESRYEYILLERNVEK